MKNIYTDTQLTSFKFDEFNYKADKTIKEKSYFHTSKLFFALLTSAVFATGLYFITCGIRTKLSMCEVNQGICN